MKQVLGSHGGYDVVSYRKDMKEYLNNNIERHVSLINNELIRICQLLIIIFQFIFLELKLQKIMKKLCVFFLI
jgi:hypothetical protein